MTTSDELLKPTEAAHILGVGYDTLTRWANEGHVPFVRVGKGMRRYYRQDIERLLQAHSQVAG